MSLSNRNEVSRRTLLKGVAACGTTHSLRSLITSESVASAESPAKIDGDGAELAKKIADPAIRAGFQHAIEKNLIPAARQLQYPGHFTVTADGVGYGADSTWPGLDAWQMAGAYLRMGRSQLVTDHFDFVRASQRTDGQIPFAIFPGTQQSDGAWLRGLRHPQDVYAYTPPQREGLTASSQETKSWIGLFSHWQPKADPLRTLGSVSYMLTAGEIFDTTRSAAWLEASLKSIVLAANFLHGLTSTNGLIAGSGFYTELPPRYGWDGVTQCYVVHAFRRLAMMATAAGQPEEAAVWNRRADALATQFRTLFWRQDHFGEYIHAERGFVDSHGLSDVNWAAVAFGVATDEQAQRLWPRLTSEPAFWAGGMPTQSVTKPASYEEWEFHEPLPFEAPPLKDAAAMGRVWYLETLACRRMRDSKRLVESTRLVCHAADEAGYWRERYQLQPDGSITPVGADKYCEYPAVLARTVFDNVDLFCT